MCGPTRSVLACGVASYKRQLTSESTGFVDLTAVRFESDEFVAQFHKLATKEDVLSEVSDYSVLRGRVRH